MPSRFLRLPQLTEHTSEREQQNQGLTRLVPAVSDWLSLKSLMRTVGTVRSPARLTGSAQNDRYWFSDEAAMCGIWISRRPGQLAA